MQAKKAYENNLIAYLYLFNKYNANSNNNKSDSVDKKQFIDNLIQDMQPTSIGYAGFDTKDYLRQHLGYHLFDKEDCKKIPSWKLNDEKFLFTIERTLAKCKEVIPSQPTKVFIFPSFNSFVKEQTVSGFCPGENIIHVYSNPNHYRKKELINTVCHEYNHSLITKWDTLLDSIVYEGLAEHFRKFVVGGKKAPWSIAVSKNKCKEYLSALEDKLNSKSYKLYTQVFFGTGEYPYWLGYSLGYNLVGSYLQNNNKNWKEIMKIKPREIYDCSGF